MTWHASVLTLFPAMFPGSLGQSLAEPSAMETGVWSPGRHQYPRTLPAIGTGGGGRHPIRWRGRHGAAAGHRRRGGGIRGGWPSDGVPDSAGPAFYPDGCPAPAFRHRIRRDPAVRPLRRHRPARNRGTRDVDEISIGDYVLSGGELAAMVLLDSIVRLLPGVMGAARKVRDGRRTSPPACWNTPTTRSRPAEWQGRRVPDVLLSGYITVPSLPGGRRDPSRSPANAAPISRPRPQLGKQEDKVMNIHPAVRSGADRQTDRRPRRPRLHSRRHAARFGEGRRR